MADLIIKDIETLQQHFPVAYTENGFKRIASYIEIAQYNYLEEVLGEDLLNALVVEHNGAGGSSGSGSESGSGSSSASCLSTLLPYVQKAAAFIAIYEGWSALEINIDLNAITQVNDKDGKPIYSGQRTAARLDTLKHGVNFLERMLVFMEKNKDDMDCLSDWKASDERTVMLGHILPTARIFTDYWSSMNNKRLTYMALRSRMLDIETREVKSTLGDTLYAEFMGQLSASDGLSTANQKLLPFLRPMVAKLTAAQGMPELQLHIEAYGVYHFLTEKNEKNTEVMDAAKDHRVEQVRSNLLTEGEATRQQLIDFLNKNVDDYPLFTASDSYTDVTLSEAEGSDDEDLDTGNIASMI